MIEGVMRDGLLFVKLPYNERFLTRMRARIHQRNWNASTKEWIFSVKDLQEVVNIAKEIREPVRLSFDYHKVGKAPIQDEGFYYKTTPFKHQREGLVYLYKHLGECILGDDMGTGKTKQVIDLAVNRKKFDRARHVLIVVCVDSLKRSWQNEVAVHSDERGYILGTRYRKNGSRYTGSVQQRYEDLERIDELPLFLITNKDTLKANKQVNVPGKGKKRDFYFVRKVNELVESGDIDFIVLDEAHLCKNTQSQQGQAVLKLHGKILPMTGTPLENSPLDAFVPLTLIGAERHSFYTFRQFYCKFGMFNEVTGYRNLEKLQEKFAQCLLRRKKADVLPDLPPKLYQDVYVEMGKEQEEIYLAAKQQIVEQLDKIKTMNNPLTAMLRMRQATGAPSILTSVPMPSAKADKALELVQGIVAQGEKVLILSNWVEVLTTVENVMTGANIGWTEITGAQNDEQKADAEDKFNKRADIPVCFGTISAMGVGLNLQAANWVIFLDEPWNLSKKEQAEDRTHRAGQKKTVNIVTLYCEDTIDERIHSLLIRKQKPIDKIMSGDFTRQEAADLVDYLLS